MPTLLDCLLRAHPDTPKSRAKQWILAGRVSVNGAVVRKPHQILAEPGDAVELGGREAAALDCGAGWRIHPRVSLLFLDRHLAVVNKGPGIISVPAAGSGISALSVLADFLAGRLKVRGRVVPQPYRGLEILPVHRLDQYTSGVLCMAANPEARRRLIEQVRARTMKREYVAFAEGRPPAPRGAWRNWLQLSRDELRQHVLSETQAKAAGAEADEAVTHFEVIAEYPLANGRMAAKLRLRLESGLKHQIRVQAAHAGLPLIGDRIYNPGCTRDFPRQALHAAALELEHPAQSGRRMKWKAELPDDLRQLEAKLRAGWR